MFIQLTRRHLEWAPLLLIGLAISYAVIDNLTTEPCPQERAGRPLRNLLTAVFALYFLAGYWLMVTRRNQAMAIATLWAWQLLVLSPVIAPAGCAEATSRDRLGEMTGLGIGLVLPVVVVFAALTSLVMPRRPLVPMAALATLCFALIAIGAWTFVPRLQDVLRNFGADLPTPTLALLEYHGYVWLAVVACALLLIRAVIEPRRTDREPRIESTLSFAALIGANMVLSAALLGAYLPVISMCRCV